MAPANESRFQEVKWGKGMKIVRFFIGVMLIAMCVGLSPINTSLAPVNSPADFVRLVILARDGWLFELWLALGAVLAVPMFASSVVAMPLLLDRKVNVKTAVLTSWQVVLANPAVMAWWAALIMGFTFLGLASLLLGLILVIPMLGHASWHAYRDLVGPAGAH